jgi:hypothetical protein
MHSVRVLVTTRARTAFVGLATLLLQACGGKSVAGSGEDPANSGGSSGTGGNSTTASPNGGGPSLNQLKGYCDSLCERFNACPGSALRVEQCTDLCFPSITLASRSVSCARLTEDYLVCLNAADDLCTETPLLDWCQDERSAARVCIDDYCQMLPRDIECKIR